MGLNKVMAQNGYFRAIQNAKRLHGAPNLFGSCLMYSPAGHAVSHTMTQKKTKVARKVRAATRKNAPVVEIPPLLGALTRPFNAQSAKWLDPDVSKSGTATSRLHFTFNPSSVSGANTANHNAGFWINPYPYYAMNVFYETAPGAGTFTDIAAGGTYINALSVPNLNSLVGIQANSVGSLKIRCVGIGVRIRYGGTELNRSTNILNGLFVSSATASAAAGVTFVSEHTALGQAAGGFTYQQFKDGCSDYNEVRIPTEGFMEYFWKPSRVPSYQLYNSQYAPATGVGAGATNVFNTTWNAPLGGAGIETGQNVLGFLFAGDTTSTSIAAGNSHDVDVVWHWELCPSYLSGVTYDIDYSPADSREMDIVTNAVSHMINCRMIESALNA